MWGTTVMLAAAAMVSPALAQGSRNQAAAAAGPHGHPLGPYRYTHQVARVSGHRAAADPAHEVLEIGAQGGTITITSSAQLMNGT